ncbi:MAG TPA: tRNA pseudouridine(38-40) synthase TruA [Candidatus Methanoperedenaceae archaeon]|nr:tRNA pseudouridine(38-40) synthase TruA [Candidatus Methanoperedenaceae archaeon]
MRYAYRLAYIGTEFSGSQVQPDVRTIEGELFTALQGLGIITSPEDADFASAGRTDAGVHALSQTIAFNTGSPAAIPRAINSKLPEPVWLWARAEVGEDFDPRRHATAREYRYFMCSEGHDIPRMRNASTLLRGEHDFTNFATVGRGKNPVRIVERLDIRVAGDVIIIDIKANAFLWHMVRKIVTALSLVGSGARNMDWLSQMLAPGEFKEGLTPAPAYGLLLKNIEYPGLKWQEDAYTKRLAEERMYRRFMHYSVMSWVFREFRQGMQ